MAARIILALTLIWLGDQASAISLPEYLSQSYPKDPQYLSAYQELRYQSDLSTALATRPDPVRLDQKKQSALVEQARAALRQARATAATEALANYWQVHQAQLELERAQTKTEYYDLRAEAAKIRLQAGFASDLELSQAQSEAESAHVELAQAQKQLSLAKANYPIETESLPPPPPPPKNLDARQNPEYLQARIAYFDALRVATEKQGAGYSGLEQAQAQRDLREQEALLRQVEKNRQEDLADSLATLATNRQQLELAEIQIQTAREELAAAQTRLARGAGTRIDLIAAQQALLEAIIQRETLAHTAWQTWLTTLAQGGV